MKKVLFIPLLFFAVFTIVACVNVDKEPFVQEPFEASGQQGGKDESEPDTTAHGNSSRYLVLYASRTDNTERVARFIQSLLGCDLLEVEPEIPYEDDYNAMLGRAQEELAAIRQGNYPPVKTSVKSFDNYDTVFIGYPIWYGSMATPMQSFLHENAAKLAGKQIALFATSGSSGISSSIDETQALCPSATIINPALLLTSSTLSQMESRVTAWLEEIGVSREETEISETISMKVNITVGDRTITAIMENNAAGRDFLSRLPLDVTLEDYNNATEKIFYPSPALTIDGVTRGCAPTPGDITIYEPWGNVAIFCKSWPHSNDLIKIGRIDGNGIEALRTDGNIQIKMERE